MTVSYTHLISKQIDEREYVLSARLEIEKVNETFGLDLPESDDYLTVGAVSYTHLRGHPNVCGGSRYVFCRFPESMNPAIAG